MGMVILNSKENDDNHNTNKDNDGNNSTRKHMKSKNKAISRTFATVKREGEDEIQEEKKVATFIANTSKKNRLRVRKGPAPLVHENSNSSIGNTYNVKVNKSDDKEIDLTASTWLSQNNSQRNDRQVDSKSFPNLNDAADIVDDFLIMINHQSRNVHRNDFDNNKSSSNKKTDGGDDELKLKEKKKKKKQQGAKQYNKDDASNNKEQNNSCFKTVLV